MEVPDFGLKIPVEQRLDRAVSVLQEAKLESHAYAESGAEAQRRARAAKRQKEHEAKMFALRAQVHFR